MSVPLGDTTSVPKAFSDLTGTASANQLPGGAPTGTGPVVMQNSPALTGTPTAVTVATSDNSTSIATTAWVKNQGYSTGGGSGTVTSVGLADSTGVFTITGSPVSTSGTLTLSALASQTAKTFLAAPNGANGTPSFRTIVASDVPTLNQNTTGSSASSTTATNVAGGATGSIHYQSAANTTAMLAGNTAATDQVVVSHGTGSAAQAPTLTNAPALSAASMTSFPTLNQNTTGTAGGLSGTPNIACGTISATGQITSTLSTGTAPFSVSSTTQVNNLNVSQLVGATWVSPGTIGSTTANTGTFTTIQGKRINVHGGTAIASGNIALSSGWGTSPTLTINRGVDQAASIQITAKATTAANPTVTVTFADGTFTQIPIVIPTRTDITAATGAPTASVGNEWVPTTVSATQVVFTFNGTPVANSTYGLAWIAIGT